MSESESVLATSESDQDLPNLKIRLSQIRGNLEWEKKGLANQLDLPNALRDLKYRDPRGFFSRLFTGNSKSSELKAEIDKVSTLILNLQSVINLVEEFQKLEPLFQSRSMELAFADLSAFHWLRSRVEHFARLVIENSGKTKGFNRLEELQIEQLQGDLKIFSSYLKGSLPRNPLIFRYNASVVSRAEKAKDSEVDEILGRDVEMKVSLKLFALAHAYSVEPTEFIKKFRSMDEMGQKIVLRKMGGEHVHQGMDDPYVIYLTALTYSLDVSEKSLLDDFNEIYFEFLSRNKDEVINDAALVMFVRLKREFGRETKDLVSDFYNVAETLSELGVSLELDDHQVVHLMLTGYRAGVHVSEIVERFVAVYEEAKKRRPEPRLSIKATMALARLTFEASGKARNVVSAVDAFFEVDRLLKQYLPNVPILDSDRVRIIFIADRFSLELEEVVGFVAQASEMSRSGELKFQIVSSAVEFAFEAKLEMNAKPSELTEDEIWQSLQIPLVDHRSIDEWLYDNYQEERANRNSRSRSVRSSYSSYKASDNEVFGSALSTMSIYNLATGGGFDSNLFTPW